MINYEGSFSVLVHKCCFEYLRVAASKIQIVTDMHVPVFTDIRNQNCFSCLMPALKAQKNGNQNCKPYEKSKWMLFCGMKFNYVCLSACPE